MLSRVPDPFSFKKTTITKPRSNFPRRRRGDIDGAPPCVVGKMACSDSISSCVHSEISTVSTLSFSGRSHSRLKRTIELEVEYKPDTKRSKKDQEIASTDSNSVLESSCVESASISKIARNSPNLACSERISTVDTDSACVESDLVLISSDECDVSSSNHMISWSGNSLCSLISSSSYASSSTGGGSSDGAYDTSGPSIAFAQFLQLTRMFTGRRIAANTHPKGPNGLFGESLLEFEGRRLIEEENEESYKRLRGRERHETSMHNYISAYNKSTNHGDLISAQRSIMINWIFQRCQEMEFQMETLFLGVALMDRFLGRGYFKTERNLQLLGIACITLATRIEENQIRNRLRQRTFKVGSNAFGRSEVVAMEWLVQEVLHFKCLTPTTLNFLWFYLKAAMVGPEVQEKSRLLAVLSLMDHTRLSFWPSTQAAGIVILACLSTGHDHLCSHVMETHIRTKDDDLPECIKRLCCLFISIAEP
ncbi:cyclin-SDS-like isoform X1 [Carex rostrata]